MKILIDIYSSQCTKSGLPPTVVGWSITASERSEVSVVTVYSTELIVSMSLTPGLKSTNRTAN